MVEQVNRVSEKKVREGERRVRKLEGNCRKVLDTGWSSLWKGGGGDS